MKCILFLVLLLAIVTSHVAVAVVDRERVRAAFTISHTEHAPEGYELLGRADTGKMVELIIAIKQQNTDKLEDKFWAVSDPKSQDYGNFMNLQEITKLIRPSKTSLSVVREWLYSHGVQSDDIEVTLSQDFITAKVSVSTAETLLNTNVYSFKHKSGVVVSRAVGPLTVPVHVKEHVDFVAGLSRFPNLDSRRHRKPSPYHRHVQAMQTGVSNLNDENQDAIPTAPGTNAPTIISGLPGNNQLALILRPLCSNGSFPVDQSLSCGGNAMTQFNIKLSPQNRNTITVPVSVSETHCNNNPNDNNHVNCMLALDANLNFIATNVSVQTAFHDNTVSDAFDAAVPVFMGPWTTPQGLGLYYGHQGRQGNHPDNMQSVAEFLEQYYDPQDLKNFFDQNGLARVSVDKVIGPNNETHPGGEATLDIEYIMAVGVNVTTWFWSVASPATNEREPYMTWLKEFNKYYDSEIPQVHSVSYGDDEGVWTDDEVKRINNEFKKAGTRGISIIFSSGDDGVGNVAVRINGTGECTPFNPSFPASSPYVTTVGATQFSTFATPQCSGNSNMNLRYDCNEVKEIACSSDTGGVITTGGGFSNKFSRPNYQANAVQSFLNRSQELGNLPSAKNFKRNNRGYPDVAVMGHNFLVVLAGQTIPIHGTSASAPTFAGMIALINDMRLNKGYSTLGFLNPMLYSIAEEHSDAFYDVTVGNNKCAASRFPEEGNCCSQGFEAIPGWDPVTGLGSPQFERLSEIIMQKHTNTVSKTLFWGVSGVLIACVVCLAAGIVAMFVYFRRSLKVGGRGEAEFLINN